MFACQIWRLRMTAEEVYESVTNGGTSDFAAAVEIFERFRRWCLIGGLAVNCYAEPVYTLDADFVVIAPNVAKVQGELTKLTGTRSELKIQLTTDPRYQDFPARAERREVLGLTIPVAALDDLVQGKIWAWQDADRRLTKRKKDELDLLRLAEAHPQLARSMPKEIARQLKSEG